MLLATTYICATCFDGLLDVGMIEIIGSNGFIDPLQDTKDSIDYVVHFLRDVAVLVKVHFGVVNIARTDPCHPAGSLEHGHGTVGAPCLEVALHPIAFP